MSRNICVNKFNSLLNDLELSTKIEDSIYNYTTSQSKKKGIELDIENKYFLRIYVNKIISLFNNLDKNSYVNN